MAGNHNSGRKPVPANIHVLTGNRAKKPGADLQVMQPPVAIPDAPDLLTGEALAEWRRVTPLLEQMGLVAEVYRAPLVVYCQAWARYVQAERVLAEMGSDGLVAVTPNGFQVMSTWLTISNRAAEQMKSFAIEFGMTPSAISRVTSSPQLDLFGAGGEGAPTKSPARFFNR